MYYKILWDNDVILDLLSSRTDENPYIFEIEKYILNYKIPIYISSSQLSIIKITLSECLKNSNININDILRRFVETYDVRVLKTPSYIDIYKWYSDDDIEKELIKLTAEAFDLYILTRDEKFLETVKDKGVHPKDFVYFISNSTVNQKINMLDLTRETLYIYHKIEKNMDKVIKESNFILGSEVKQLEEKTAKYLGVKHCIGCSSGTDALVLSLRALAIKLKEKEYFDKTDEIITTPFTFTATGDAILRAGATPVFIDIDLDTYTIDTEKIKEYLKTSKNVIGIIPVHLYGHPANMDEIVRIAKENNLFVIEDVAQAFGGMWDNKKLGSIGTAGCFSFFPSKNLGGFGDGGMVSTNDDDLAEIVRMLIKHGGKDKYNVDHIGYNARLDTLQAAIILAKFDIIDDFNKKRRNIAKLYTEGLKEIEWLKTPIEKEKAYHVFHQYTILLTGKSRDEVQERLKQQGISTMVYYPYPLHKMKVFISNGMKVYGSLQNSEYAAKNVLSLPIEPLYDEKTIYKIIEKLREM
jgi:dTDP-4-amino-4,6-dideoxygalactose transaminase